MSRRLADLEYRLGYPLFQRQVAGVLPTSAGERLLEPAKKMADWAGEVARAAAQGETGGPRGVVRVTAPPGVAFNFVAALRRGRARPVPGAAPRGALLRFACSISRAARPTSPCGCGRPYRAIWRWS